MEFAAGVFGPVFEPREEAGELLHGLVVGLFALLGGGELGVPDDAAAGVGAGPGDDRGGAGAEEVDPVEGAVLQVKAGVLRLDQVLPDVVAVQVEVEGCLQLAGVGAAAGDPAFAPAGRIVNTWRASAFRALE